MLFLKSLFGIELTKSKKTNQYQPKLLKVGIIGTGKIGTDLLVKIQRSPLLTCVMFAGRNLESEGMRYAANLGVPLSDKGIDAFTNIECDVVFDATSAAHHIEHAKFFAQRNILAIDMTPSQIGECCVPALGLSELTYSKNISMISCGGQSSIPVAATLAVAIPEITHLEVRSIVSANSIGPGTIANIAEYYQNTKAGLSKYTGIPVTNMSVDLQVDEVNLETKMLTSVKVFTTFTDVHSLETPIQSIFEKVQEYVPGYKLESAPILEADGIRINLSVEGLGDYLPKYAGNLDIINCAAIAVAEEYAGSGMFAKHTREIEMERSMMESATAA